MRAGLQVPPLTGDTRDEISGMVPSVGSFARNPVDAWRAFYDPEYMSRMLEIVFEDPALDMILLDRLIPRMTYASPEEKDTSQITIQYLRENRHRKPLVAVVDGAGEDPYLAGESAGLRQRYCRAGIPAYPSLPLAAQALARVAAYYERKPSVD
jgi:acyl-CoA synthetase (NDP forming)